MTNLIWKLVGGKRLYVLLALALIFVIDFVPDQQLDLNWDEVVDELKDSVTEETEPAPAPAEEGMGVGSGESP